MASPELARHLTELSAEIGRQVGVLLDRRGDVAHIIVGDAFKLELPDLGRARAGESRLRGLRLVHTHLKGESLTRDDLTDLALLRLDLVCALEARHDGLPGACHVGYLRPERAGQASREGDTPGWITQSFPDIHSCDVDVLTTVDRIEDAFSQAMATRTVAAEGRAVLVGVSSGGKGASAVSMLELKELCRTASVEVLDTVVQARPRPDHRYVVGEGKIDEINLRSMQLLADMLVFDCNLSPAQARQIAERTSLKVIDRTQLILDIFARRAQSADGKLQVELAQLEYMLPRLVGGDPGLSRLSGGIGGRGPGETKLEMDRRKVRDRITMLKQRLERLASERQVRRRRRGRQGVPVIAIVGYTNAGKSTLLNALTQAGVLAEDKLFATLDPTSRRLRFPRDREVVLTDTVGFIRDLPKTLVQAFRATLEELGDADLLLHVVDATDPERDAHRAAVEKILTDLNVTDVPRLLVFNKIDGLDVVDRAAREAEAAGQGGLCVSAHTRDGFDALLLRAEEILWHGGRPMPPDAAALAHTKAQTAGWDESLAGRATLLVGAAHDEAVPVG